MSEFELDEDEVKAELDRREKMAVRSRDVCICGHPVSAHSSGVFFRGEVKQRCVTGKLECGCTRPTPVLRAGNLRLFQKKSTGNGGMHGLTLALHACNSQEPPVFWEWIQEPYCWNCGDKEASVAVCRILHPSKTLELGGKILENTNADRAEENAFLCKDCRESDKHVNLWVFPETSDEKNLPDNDNNDNVVPIR